MKLDRLREQTGTCNASRDEDEQSSGPVPASLALEDFWDEKQYPIS